MIASPLERLFVLLKTPLHLLQSHRWHERRVGLFGGSFNPPHQGHLHICQVALRNLHLDAVWWLVTPQNPLKESGQYNSLPVRLQQTQNVIAQQPKMLAMDIEVELGTTRSYDTLQALNRCFARTHFVFLLGMDNALSFHHWYRWREIPHLLPLAILGRPPAIQTVQNCPLRQSRHYNHHHLSRAEYVDLSSSTCFWLQGNKLEDVSSSKLRKSL